MRASPNPPNQQLAVHSAECEHVAADPHKHGNDRAGESRLFLQ